MFCRNCGSPIGQDDKFCAYCGTRVKNMDDAEKKTVDSDTDIFFGEEKIKNANVSNSENSTRYERVEIHHIPQKKENNGMAIAGFILSFLFPIVGLILSIISYDNSKKMGEPNKLALAGIIISICSLVLSAISEIISAIIMFTK